MLNIYQRVFPVLVALLFAGVLQAHDVNSLYSEFEQDGDSWTLNILFDAALAVPEIREDRDRPQPPRDWLYDRTEQEHQAMQQEAVQYITRLLSVSYGNEACRYEVVFPEFEQVSPDFPQLLSGGAYFTAEVKGVLPKAGFISETKDFDIAVNKGDFPDLLIRYVHGENPEWGDEYCTIEPEGEAIVFKTARKGNVFSLVKIGFFHVIPDGLDHILFIVALFFAVRKLRVLLLQSLVFTVAHSCTLALCVSGALGYQHWPAQITSLIEPLIAFSIIYLALENIFRRKRIKSRLVVIFLFGLIHGLGFASSLGSYLKFSGDWFLPLMLANLGIELAQVCVLVSMWCLTIWLAKSEFHYSRVSKCGSLAIALCASWMFFQRIF